MRCRPLLLSREALKAGFALAVLARDQCHNCHVHAWDPLVPVLRTQECAQARSRAPAAQEPDGVGGTWVCADASLELLLPVHAPARTALGLLEGSRVCKLLLLLDFLLLLPWKL